MSDRLPAITDDPGQARRDLLEHGLCLVGGLLSTDTVSDIRTALYRAAKQDEARGVRQKGFGLDYGDGNHRVWNVLSRDPVFVQLVQHPVALTLVRDTLGWPALLGNFSANIALPGSDGGALHADQVFVPEPWCDEPQGCNIAWCVDDFTACNGATRVVPGSHRLGRNHRPEDGDHSVPLIAPAGTMVALQSRLWHRTGNNESDKPRAALFAWYSRTIYRTQENWFLSLSPWVLENASDELLTLLAYRTEGFGLVNGHSPR
ncbi:MAG: phytanoyl-CoA dioxygenase family protein [Pseudomonadales bacterium]|nr:phytanoyl-CoA dioxygenase family protein [Pseudomonadales bacterium]MCP5184702.1 phytanoyl-CoA dioxygenase family protein [Pseudomonadales bacterium]